MRARAAALAGALLVATAATCAPRAPDEASDATACFQFERNEGARALGLPWGVVLEDQPLGEGWPISQRAGVRRAATATSLTGRDDVPFAYWVPLGGDSVEIGYPGGGGVVLTLGRSGQDLIGGGVAAGDAVPLGGVIGPRPPVLVVARNVLCSAS